MQSIDMTASEFVKEFVSAVASKVSEDNAELKIELSKVSEYHSYIQFLQRERDYYKGEANRTTSALNNEWQQRFICLVNQNIAISKENESLRGQRSYLLKKNLEMHQENLKLTTVLKQHNSGIAWDLKTKQDQLKEARNLLIQAANFIYTQVIAANCSADERELLVLTLSDTAKRLY